MSSLYRRHRPQAFSEVVGQTAIVRTLGNAIDSDKVHHAYLFVGSRGTGKTSIAKILARSLNCVDGPTLAPCGKCESCVAIASGTSLDVIEMDAASNNSVDDIRDLREKVGFAPALGARKVYILDEAHMLSTAAWNAFLKTLEEPPPHAIFVLATTESHKVPATIVDRCHRFDFRRPSIEELVTVLRRVAESENIQADDRALVMIARAAAGSFRDALGTLDQLVTYGGDTVSLESVMELLDVSDAELIFAITDAIAEREPRVVLERVAELADSGRDPVQFMRDLTEHLRQLVVVQTLGAAPETFSVTADQTARLEQQANDIEQAEAIRTIDLVAAAIAACKEGSDPRIQLEVALLKASAPKVDASLEAVFSRLSALESGTAPAPGAAKSKPKRTPPPAQAVPAEIVEPVEAKTEEPEPEPPQASKPEPQPDPEPAPGNGAPVDLDVSVFWPAVLERVREVEGGDLLAEYLSAARPKTIEGDVLVLAYPHSASFSKRKVEHPANGMRITETLQLVAGRPLRVHVELTDEPAEEKIEQLVPEIDEEELIRRVKEAFNAEEVVVGESPMPADTGQTQEG